MGADDEASLLRVLRSQEDRIAGPACAPGAALASAS
jgi:hypothetical protein